MTGAETTVERLRQYLSHLTPQARSLLIGELERSVLRGDDVTGADPAMQELLLNELRRIVRDEREGAPRVGHAVRLFYRPIEPFMVDDRADHRHPGRIARCSLEPLWTWISRDLLPAEAKTFSDEAGKALVAGDEPKAVQLARAFHERVAAAIEAAFAAADDEKRYRRLMAQIGTPRAADDATTLRIALKNRDALATFAAHLPLRIAHLTGAEFAQARALVDGIAARERSLLLYAVLIVMNRLSSPWQLIRFGVEAAGCDIAARVAEMPDGITVTIVLAELERLIGELRDGLRSGQGIAVGALLKSIHDAARGLRTEIDLPVDSTWGRVLAGQRAQIAELLRSQIESAPGRVRRLLRPRSAGEVLPDATLDAAEVAETEALVEFAGICRTFAGELALNEMTQRTYSELQVYLDSATRALLDGLRQPRDGDRAFRQSQVDAAVRLCAKVFGIGYAVLLEKAAEVAGQIERRLARG